MIRIHKLNKSFIRKGKSSLILNDISLEVAKGEIFGIIGRSGAGKSTLLKCINMLEKADSGSISIDGTDLTLIPKDELRKIRQSIGVIFQGFNLLNSKNVFANVALPLILEDKLNQRQIEDRVYELLALVGLSEFALKYPSSLSGGQKQRVGIARALATNPKLLLSDEATSALDAQTTNEILELLLDINRKLGLTIVLITHEIEVVKKICDRVAVIDSGKIVECAPTVNIVLHPQHDITRKLIIEEETLSYLQQVAKFYQFTKSVNNHLILVSFLGDQTFQPILGNIAKSGVSLNILRGELGRIKNMPFGQLLLELKGSSEELERAIALLKQFALNYEVLY